MHSIVLAAASDYFEFIFSHHDKSVHLDFVDSKTLEAIISFCYTGQLELNPENIGSISIAAHELKMLQLKSACSQFIESTATAENSLQYALIAEKCGFGAAKELIQKFLTENCANICKSTDTNVMNTSHMSDIAQNLCENNSEVFEDVIKSVKSINDDNSSLLSDAYRAIYKSFVSFCKESNKIQSQRIFKSNS